MRYRGLSPSTALTRWALAALALGITLGATAPMAISGLAGLLAAQSTTLPWIASRLLGFIAYLALAASVVYGLLLSTKLLDAVAHRPVTFTLHQDLASIGLGLAAVHGALLGLDHSVPASIGQLLLPFTTAYRPQWVGLGQLAFWLCAAVVASFYVRRRIGQRAWRTLHYATFLAFVGATAHGLGSGTDTAGGAWWLYVAAGTAVAFLLAYRIAVSAVSGAAGRRGATAAGEQ
jgi:predicted ferric reductase